MVDNKKNPKNNLLVDRNNKNKKNNEKKRQSKINKQNPKRRKRYSRKNNDTGTNTDKDSNVTGNIIIRFPPMLMNSENETSDPVSSEESLNHLSTYFDDVIDEDLILLDKEINTIDDLITLGNSFDPTDKKKYTIDIETLNKLVTPLTKLKTMVGMDSVKDTIVNLILYNIQNFEKKNSSMLHTVIEGNAGTGKTEVAKIIGDIYLKMGILKNNKFKAVKRNDLVGQYLGHTANKTQEAINDAKGGVLFIDEAYSLGNPEGRDSYSKECIDIINQNLSEGKSDFVCIVAGYPNALKKSFFNYNEGLERRFPYRFKIKDYDASELKLIFIKIVNENKWKFKDNYSPAVEFFEKNKKYFKFFGGDLENFFNSCRIAHARRAMTIHPKYKKCLTKEDLEKGLEYFINNDEIKKRNEEDNTSVEHMYM